MSDHDTPRDERRSASLWGAPDPPPETRDDEHEADAAEPGTRPDPRLRPPDPAGTQPKYDPGDLLPRGRPALAGFTSGVPEAEAVEVDPSSHEDDDGDLLPARLDAATAAAVAEARETDEPPHAPRFQFMLGALVAVAVAALAATIALAIGINNDNTTATPQSNWSAWQPVAGAGDGATQIANHVGHEYRLPEGGQLVLVTGGPMEIAGLPLTVAIRETAAQGGDIKLIGGKGVLYRLCGLGDKCAIAKGKPSTQRHLLLRREALELALYSFHYLKDVDHAVVLLPPPKGKDATQALFFQKSDLGGELARPLNATLVPTTPSVASVAASPDAPLVNTITTRTLFQFSLTQANQDARAFLVLDPITN